MGNRLIYFVLIIIGSVLGYYVAADLKNKQLRIERALKEKLNKYYNILNQWLFLKNKGILISDYFESKGYKSIAIYGVGELGSRLYEELKKSNIKVKYCIDKNFDDMYCELDIYSLDDNLEKVDAIVVTPIYSFSQIEKDLRKKIDYKIISLEDVIYNIY